MRKKLIFLVLLLVLIIAVILCGCDFNKNKVPNGPDDDDDLSWRAIESPTPTDVYNRLLSGFMNVATDFSIKSLSSSPKLGADAKLKITVGELVLWASFKGNYNNTDKANAMFSFEISTVEDSYNDVVLAVYLFKEYMYATIGETKFKFDMSLKKWNNIFPFDMSLDNSKAINNIASFMYMVLAVKDNKIDGQTRLNGLVEEYKFAFSLDLAETLKKVQTYLANNTNQNDTEFIGKINKIFANVLGLSIDNIKQGKVPDSEVDINFATQNTKISSFNCDIHIDQSGEYANTLFAGEDIDIKLQLIKMETSKTNVSIDFVNSKEKQNQFIEYHAGDYAFKIGVEIDKIINLESKESKKYNLVLSAKIFQDESLNNFMLLEYYDKATDKLEKAFYVYENQLYIFDTIENILVCTNKMQLDLSDVASKVFSNRLTENPPSSFSLFNTISYIIGALKIETNEVLFNISNKLFSEVWYNYDQLLIYLDSLMVESIFEEENMRNFESFISDYDSIADFYFHKEFLSMIDNTDINLINAIERMSNCTPLVIFTPISE